MVLVALLALGLCGGLAACDGAGGLDATGGDASGPGDVAGGDLSGPGDLPGRGDAAWPDQGPGPDAAPPVDGTLFDWGGPDFAVHPDAPSGPDGHVGPDGGLLEDGLTVPDEHTPPDLGPGPDAAGPDATRPDATGDVPVAVIACSEGQEVTPQTVLHLDGGGSFGLSDIARWQWRVEQPEGSVSVFVPSDNFPSPTFEANVAGTYTFYLRVWDERDDASAEASYTVLVIPEAAGLHIELLWHTPGDSDETDEGPYAGSDLDLHFMHPDAPLDTEAPDLDGDGAPDPYFDTPLDAFWFNPEPDWGVSSDPSDNPSLDRDDTDGGGPENLNLAYPESGARYRVGVHYWDDHGFGPAYATVRVYVGPDLMFENPEVRLENHDLWCVAFIDWPSGQVLPCEPPEGPAGEPWIVPDYQNPNFRQW